MCKKGFVAVHFIHEVERHKRRWNCTFLGEFNTPRKGKMTISRTSIPDLIGKLIDRYIEEKKLDYDLVRLSRAKVMEIAVLQFLDQKGVLDKFLAEQGYPDARVKRIKQYLQSVN